MNKEFFLTLRLIAFSTALGIIFFHFNEKEINELKEAVLKETYSLSPMKLMAFEKGKDEKFLQQNVSFAVELAGLPTHYFSVYLESEEKLVLTALARLISNKLIENSLFSENSFSNRRDRTIKDFINTVIGWGQVENLILVDLSRSVEILSQERLFQKKEVVLHDRYLLNLLSSFLTWPFIDKTGERAWTPWSEKKGIPTGSEFGFLSQVLLNYYFDDLDRAFKVKFPKMKYARFDYEVRIPIYNQKDFNVKMFTELIEELDLIAKVTIIVPGGFPIPFVGGDIFLNREGDIQIITESEG